MKARLLVVFAVAAYVAAAWLPASALWYSPGDVRFGDTTIGRAPDLIFSRAIHRVTMIQYSVVVRSAETGDIECDGAAGPFEYRPASGPLVGRDLVWWASGNTACAMLPPGTYWVQTVWVLPTPLRALLPEWAKGTPLDYLLPPKKVVRNSPAFTVREG